MQILNDGASDDGAGGNTQAIDAAPHTDGELSQVRGYGVGQKGQGQ